MTDVHLELICQAPLNVIVDCLVALGLFVGLASLAINLNKFSSCGLSDSDREDIGGRAQQPPTQSVYRLRSAR